MDDKIRKLKEIVDNTDNLVFFGGAGGFHGKRYPGFSKHRRTLQYEIQISAGDDREPYIFCAKDGGFL